MRGQGGRFSGSRLDSFADFDIDFELFALDEAGNAIVPSITTSTTTNYTFTDVIENFTAFIEPENNGEGFVFFRDETQEDQLLDNLFLGPFTLDLTARYLVAGSNHTLPDGTLLYNFFGDGDPTIDRLFQDRIEYSFTGSELEALGISSLIFSIDDPSSVEVNGEFILDEAQEQLNAVNNLGSIIELISLVDFIGITGSSFLVPDKILVNDSGLDSDIDFTSIRVQAEDYSSYFDTTSGNTGGVYRNDDVDIEPTTDISGSFNVGFIAEGEWLTYDLDIPESGLYQVVARVASDLDRDHRLDVSIDGQDTSLNFDGTGGWQSWIDVAGDTLDLNAGAQELRLDMGSSGFNINYIDLIPLEGIRIQAEDYSSYFDTTSGNSGGAYRNDDVDIEPTTDIGGGFNVGFIAEGESLTYDIDIPESGLYQVVARVASNTSDRIHRLDVSVSGQGSSLSFDGTGGWQSWIDVTGDTFNLNAGSQELRLDMGSSGFNLNYVDLIPI